MSGASESRTTHLARGLLIACSATAIALLCLEGALSLAGKPSLTTLLPGHGAEPAMVTAMRRLNQNPEPALRANEFDIDPDPRVGRVFVPDRSLQLHDAPVHTDALGMRVHPGLPRAPGCQRVVILGDSVAFGWGLKDDETIGARMEGLFDQCLAPSARPVEVRTVAVPGWNHHNEFAFLFDHLDVLAPDVVILLPVPNDLSDSIAVYETAHGVVPVPDLTSEDPWLNVGYPATLLGDLMARHAAGQGTANLSDAGSVAIDTGLGSTSAARLAQFGQVITDAKSRLESRGIKFFVAPHVGGDFTDQLEEVLFADGIGDSIIPLLEHALPEDMLPTDPHPSAEAALHLAQWLAAALVERGAVTGPLASPVPSPPPAVQARRAAPPRQQDVRDRAAAARQRALAGLRPDLDTQTGRGCLQIYGGVGLHGEVGTRALLLLRRDGDVLRLRVQALEGRADLLPLTIAVQADGAPLGQMILEAAGGQPSVQDFHLPPGAAGTPIDIKLIPSAWVTVPQDGGGFRVASFVLLGASCARE